MCRVLITWCAEMNAVEQQLMRQAFTVMEVHVLVLAVEATAYQ